MRDFTQLLKNKLRSKKYFLKNMKLGYLPVQTKGEIKATSNSAFSCQDELISKIEFGNR